MFLFASLGLCEEDKPKLTNTHAFVCWSSAADKLRFEGELKGKAPVPQVEAAYFLNEKGVFVNQGLMIVYGHIYRAQFSIKGFKRTWYWGENNDFALTIGLNGVAKYYEFNGESEAKSSMTLYCKEEVTEYETNQNKE